MEVQELAHSINKELNPNTFTIDPILIASIISIIIQIIKLIYNYKFHQQILDDVKNPGIMRRIYLSYKINQIISAQNVKINTFAFIKAIRAILADKNLSDIKNLVDSCK